MDWVRNASRSRMLATDNPTCAAKVVLNDSSESASDGDSSVAWKWMMPSASPCARIGMQRYVFFTPAA